MTSPRINILNSGVCSTSYLDSLIEILDWASRGESRSVYCANVHMIMEAYDSAEFRLVVNSADLVTPDGMPLVWLMRFRGSPDQERVYGPTLMLKVLEAAEKSGVPVGFLGGLPHTLDMLVSRLQTRFPRLKIAYQLSPPFRALTSNEDLEITEAIKTSGAKILFIGLGCPKQEKWINDHRGRINAVMIGVGAAFDFHAGVIRQAPAWMQKSGLEWLFRFTREPARLWKRYLVHNPRFVILSLFEQIHYWIHPKEKG